jgi:hypothetical protein
MLKGDGVRMNTMVWETIGIIGVEDFLEGFLEGFLEAFLAGLLPPLLEPWSVSI